MPGWRRPTRTDRTRLATVSESAAAPPRRPTQRALTDLKGRLSEAGLDTRAISRVLRRPLRGGFLLPDDLGDLAIRSPGTSSFDAVVRLFVVGADVAWRDLERAVGARAAGTLLESGIVRRDGASARARFAVLPLAGFLVCVDRSDRPRAEDTVVTPGADTLALARFVPRLAREGANLAVDVGTGCGALALLASRTYRRILALDLNPRAVAFASFNAALNGVAIRCDVCPVSPLDHASVAGADLVLFGFPMFYTDRWSPSVAHISSTGEKLLEDTYRALGRVLGPRGRAVFWHQIRSEPADAFEHQLASWDGGERLSVVYNGPIREGLGWEMGRTLVRRRGRRDPAFARAPVPFGADGRPDLALQERRDIERHLRSLRLLDELDEAAFSSRTPCVHRYVQAQQRYGVRRKRLGRLEGVRVNHLEVTEPVLELLLRCDGKSTVRALARKDRDAPDLLRELVREGIVSLV